MDADELRERLGALCATGFFDELVTGRPAGPGGLDESVAVVRAILEATFARDREDAENERARGHRRRAAGMILEALVQLIDALDDSGTGTEAESGSPGEPGSVRRITVDLKRLLLVLLRDPGRLWYGYELRLETGFATGKLYPMLDRLEKTGWIERMWEKERPPGRPRRRYVLLTPAGVQAARRVLGGGTLRAPADADDPE